MRPGGRVCKITKIPRYAQKKSFRGAEVKICPRGRIKNYVLQHYCEIHIKSFLTICINGSYDGNGS